MPDAKVTSASADNTGTLIRHAVAAIAAMLLARGVISQEFYDQFVKGLPEILVVLGLLFTVGQSLWSKRQARKRTEKLVEAALDMPEGTTKTKLVAAVPPEPSIVKKITGSGKQALPILMALALTGLLSAGIVITSSCGSFGGGDKPITVDASISREQAKRALIELQDARTLLLKSMAVVYMASPDDPAVIERVRAVDRYDTQFRQAWQLAALAVDRWDVSLFAARYAEARDNIELMKGQVNP